MCVTQQYGFTTEKIGDMCPCELKPYELAYKLHQQQIDMQNHMLGRYVRMSILSTLGNSQWFKGNHTPPFEYPDMPFLQQEVKKSENGNVESNEEIAVYEMRQRIRQLEKQGLPESPI